MPSHIFARLGLWQEDIQANLKSVALTQQSGAMYMGGHELHAMHFLLYAYLQTGQDEAARKVLEQSKQIVAAAPKNDDDTGMLRYYGFAAAHFPALYDLEMHDWKDAVALQPAANASPDMQRLPGGRGPSPTPAGRCRSARQAMHRSIDDAEDGLRKPKTPTFLMGRFVARRGSRLAGLCRETE